MKTRRIVIIETVIIVFLWLLIFALPIVLNEEEVKADMIKRIWIDNVMLFGAFIINRFLLMPLLYFKKRRIVYLISILMLLGLLSVGVYNHNKPLQKINPEFAQGPPGPHLGPPGRPPGPKSPFENRPPSGDVPAKRGNPMLPPYMNMLLLSVLFIAFDSALNISIRSVISENKQDKLKREHSQAQLALLYNQISPHFFMNMLNNIHALIEVDKVKAQASVIHLSKLMNHLLYESNKETVSLISEVEFINNYIDLMRLRFTDKVKIDTTFQGNMIGIMVPPMLFLNYIENAFKHGVSYKKDSFVKLSLSYEDNAILFSIVNSDHSKTSTHVGVGVENTRQRLDILFGDNYKLDINNTEGNYKLDLRINV